MYTVEDLNKYNYFKDADLNYVLDSLTGVISRQYILDFARMLVDSNTPFAMCMMDLDNFKYINDSYGHDAGDKCLSTVAENLRTFTGEDGLVGRFGGDEFIILYLKSNKYQDIHDFFAGLFGPDGAVRRSIYIDTVRVFITATVGSASFPLDADTYNDLFLKMDKALYRGKSKGRNCYIIYVHEKHKDIVVHERGTNSLLEKIQKLDAVIKNTTKENYIKEMLSNLFLDLHTYDVIYVDKKNNRLSARNNDETYIGNNFYFITNKILNDKDLFSTSNPKEVSERFPETYQILTKNRIHAFVIIRILDLGFIILYENNITRMWQDYDLVLINHVRTLLNYELK